MKTIFACSFLVCVLIGCAGKMYTYNYSMTYPVNNKTLLYENDTFSIAFTPKQKWIEAVIYNKSSDGIRINWDEVSFSINGKTYRALHSQTGLNHINETQPPTTIPPHSNLNEILVPSDHVSFTRTGGNLTPIVSDIFPISDYGNKKARERIQSLRGVRITIYMPFYIRNQYSTYYYDIMVDDVRAKK